MRSPLIDIIRTACALTLVVGAAEMAFAVRAPLPEGAPRQSEVLEEARFSGLRPWTMDVSHLGASYRALRAMKARRLKGAGLPSRWDSREQGWVTSIKDQRPYGTCWTFSTMAALETALLKNGRGEYDLSENHLADHDVGFTWGFNDGGNNQMATALVASWRDPLLEEQDPYPKKGASVTLPPAVHVQDVIWLPAREDAADAATDALLKEAVQTYGAVSVGYLHCSRGYNGTLGTHYMPDDSYYGGSSDGGHAVTLIGWDDNFPSNNFNATPPGPGAFLCKNSWGETAGTNGCVWISYYDKYFAYMASAAFPVPQHTNNYGRVYQYDPCGQVGSWNVYFDAADQAVGGKENWCANVFTASATGVVEAVGFYAISAGMEYELRVYANCVDAPSSGTLVSSQSGVTDSAGFFTVPLATPVAISASSERFAVVMHLETPDYDYPLPVTCDHYEDYALFCSNVAHAGESFLSSNGVDWIDFQDFPDATRTENFCLKAYTRYGADGADVHWVASAEPAAERLSVPAGTEVLFSVTVEEPGAAYAWSVDGRALAEDASRLAHAFAADEHGTHVVVCRVTCAGASELRRWTVDVTTTLHVDAASTAESPDGSAARPYPSIAQALAVALSGDEVVVAPGVYAGGLAPAVTALIRSAAGPAETFIDAADSSRCFTGSLAPDAVLAGFTLKNGNAQYGAGAYGGVLSNCVITACTANYGGGAYACTLAHCTLYGNVAYYGYGGGVFGCAVRDSIVWNNYYVDGWGRPALENWYSWATDVFSYTCTSPRPQGTENFADDPLFEDAANGDFRLQADSPCRNAASDGGDRGAWFDSASVMLGRVAQRYPWSGVLDVEYRASCVPPGTKVDLLVGLGDVVKTNELTILRNGVQWTAFDVRAAFGNLQTNNVKARVRAVLRK